MTTWYLAKQISKNYTKFVKIDDYKKVMAELISRFIHSKICYTPSLHDQLWKNR
jgi:hypothetical protein